VIDEARPRLGVALAAAAAPFAVWAGLMLYAILTGQRIDPWTVIQSGPIILLVGWAFALIPAMVIGLPVYLVLRRISPMHWWHAGFAGALIGAPLGVLVGSDPAITALLAIGGLAGGLLFRAVVGKGMP
jgi:hypothetical protein